VSEPHDVMDLTFSEAQWAFSNATDRYVKASRARSGLEKPRLPSSKSSKLQTHPGSQCAHRPLDPGRHRRRS